MMLVTVMSFRLYHTSTTNQLEQQGCGSNVSARAAASDISAHSNRLKAMRSHLPALFTVS